MNEDPELCRRIEISVAAVSAEDRELYVNPAAGLDEAECRFVMAHEPPEGRTLPVAPRRLVFGSVDRWTPLGSRIERAEQEAGTLPSGDPRPP